MKLVNRSYFLFYSLYLGLFIIISCQRYDDVLDSEMVPTMALFGGSYTVISEADICKNKWKELLDINIVLYGRSGAGFSILTNENSIPMQVDAACLDSVPCYDIYLLWASTNDYRNFPDKAGSASDYSSFDYYDDSALHTQCGGINYCIKRIKDKSPDALILFFSSTPLFNEEAGYSTIYLSEDGMAHFVKKQRECCMINNVPFLDQFSDSPLTKENWRSCFQADNIHLNENGYELIGSKQSEFIQLQLEDFLIDY